MSDPSLAIQRAVVAGLKAASTASGVAGGPTFAVYDDVPDKPSFPYAVVGDDHVLGDLAVGYDGSDTRVMVKVFSRAVGYPEVKRIAAIARAALNGLSIEGHVLVTQSFQAITYLREPDGRTRSAAVVTELLTQPVP